MLTFYLSLYIGPLRPTKYR